MTPTEPQASPAKARPFVTGNWPLEDHPAYGDEVLVAQVTDSLLAQGRTVFQLFLLDPDERTHSLRVLERLHVPEHGRVISLGSGVGGMERHWLDVRPDIEVTLVNQSMAQLARCVCPGRLVLADMRCIDCEATVPVGGHDLVVLGYSLHHCDDVPAMLAVARSMLLPGGTLLVLDVVDGSPAFAEAVQYPSIDSVVLGACGLVRLDYGMAWHRQPDEVIGRTVGEVIDRDTVRPSMWVGMA